MAEVVDDNNNNNNNSEEPMESHPFFVQAEFPFVFIPTTGFTFTNEQIDDDVVVDNQTATDDKEDEATIDDEVEPTEENNDLRISQPKYSQLLKDLDFSQARMVDVTNLLADETPTSNENESIPKVNSVNDQSQNSPSTSTDDDNDNQEALSDAANEVQNDLNHLADVLLQASQMPTDVNLIHDTQKTKSTEEDDDTSKQATQNYDLHDNEQPEMTSTTKNNNNNKSLRFSADTENLSSIPRLNPANQDEQVITWDELLNGAAAANQQPAAAQITPPKQKPSQRTRSTSSSSDDSSSRKPQSTRLTIDEDNQNKSYTTASDILIRRLSNDNLKKSQPQSKETNDTWLSMLDKLEREHKQRLEKQQQQYEEYMQTLEEKMKQRLDDYLNTTNSLNESKTDAFTTHSSTYHYRPLVKDVDKQRPTTFNSNLSRSQSREDISTLRAELTTKHAKHISDLKSYYEDEIEELKKQLNRPRMGSQPSSSTRQSIETIERINSENIRLHDEIKELRRSFKLTDEENRTLKRQIDDLRDQINRKDIDLKNYYRKLTDIEQQFNAVQTTKERQDEKFRHADRQAILFREENEKLTSELNLTRERLLRLEERYRELETENKTHRSQIFNSNNHERLTDEMKLNSTMALNLPTSREYGRFTLTTSKYSSTSSSTTTPRDTSYGADDLFQQNTSPRPLTKITEYINERPSFPQAYVPPSSRATQSRLDFIDNHIKQSEQLEEKFDDLLKKKRDLESRINRIPTRGLTSTDRQLLEVLEREMERVDHQISSVKLELRKMNILRTTH